MRAASKKRGIKRSAPFGRTAANLMRPRVMSQLQCALAGGGRVCARAVRVKGSAAAGESGAGSRRWTGVRHRA